jgi:enoyl-CoA hydratase
LSWPLPGDLRIATIDAKMGCPEINLGVIPGSGGMPRLIGIGKTKELLFSGDMVSGEEAYRIGLVNKITAKETLLDEAKAWAKKLVAKPRVAMTLLKHSIDHGMDMDLSSALTFETDWLRPDLCIRGWQRGLPGLHREEKTRLQGEMRARTLLGFEPCPSLGLSIEANLDGID